MLDVPKRCDAPPRPGRAGGFTLIELLLVMFVMAVLVALVVGVGTHVIEEGRKTETRDRQNRMLAAIDAYYKVMGKVPPHAGDPNDSLTELVDHLRGREEGDEKLKRDIYKETNAYLGASDGELSLDAFNKPMRYYSDRGVGGRPLIISAGPDGEFGDGTTNRERQRREDNIRSDTSD